MNTRPSNWWKYYTKVPDKDSFALTPPPNSTPTFQIGDIVRLKGKPERSRQILAIEWHSYRQEFAYVVETSAPDKFVWARPHSPYWFAPQLILEGHCHAEIETKGETYQRKKGIALIE